MEVLAHIFAGIIIAILILGIIISPFAIGKERKPLTPAVVVVSAILNYITVVLLFWAYFRA